MEENDSTSTRFYSKKRDLGISLTKAQWAIVDRHRKKKEGKPLPNSIHHGGDKAWIQGFSKLLKQVLQEDHRS